MNENEIIQDQNNDIQVDYSTDTAITVVKVTKQMEKTPDKNSLIYDIFVLFALLLLIVVVRQLIVIRRGKRIAEHTSVNLKIKDKTKENAKDFLELIYQLNQVYIKTDKYLKDK